MLVLALHAVLTSPVIVPSAYAQDDDFGEGEGGGKTKKPTKAKAWATMRAYNHFILFQP